MYRTPLSSVNMSFNLLHIKPRQASCQGGIIKIKCAPDICLAGKLCMRQIITESAPATHDHTRFLQRPMCKRISTIFLQLRAMEKVSLRTTPTKYFSGTVIVYNALLGSPSRRKICRTAAKANRLLPGASMFLQRPSKTTPTESHAQARRKRHKSKSARLARQPKCHKSTLATLVQIDRAKLAKS